MDYVEYLDNELLRRRSQLANASKGDGDWAVAEARARLAEVRLQREVLHAWDQGGMTKANILKAVDEVLYHE